MQLPINVKSLNNISKWQMGFNSAFKGLNIFILEVLAVVRCHVEYAVCSPTFQDSISASFSGVRQSEKAFDGATERLS
jgi:hypothetical protein